MEVSWGFRGGMDLRDEIAGTEGTIWLNHSLRTGFEMYTSGQGGGYVAEKAESESGWLFPVADEVAEYGYYGMFDEMFDAMDAGRDPAESFYDGYVVNAIIDACYRSAKSGRWEPVEITGWRGKRGAPKISGRTAESAEESVVKRERMPDGRVKVILKDRTTGEVFERIET